MRDRSALGFTQAANASGKSARSVNLSGLMGIVWSMFIPCHAVLEQAIKADAHRIEQNRRSLKALFAEITAK